jgi:drug/metabolite transporter (DMT)-like permease
MATTSDTSARPTVVGRGRADSGHGRRVALALATVYLVWGSAFLVIQVALESFPPLFMVGARYVLVGVVLLSALRLRGVPLPSGRSAANAVLVGSLMLACGSGGQHLAQGRGIPSGIAALGMGTVPLWMALFGGLWGRWPNRWEWAGLATGFVGLAVYAAGGAAALPADGLVLLLAGAVAFALGSVWRGRLVMPSGLTGTAVTMLSGGVALMLVSLARGERLAGVPGAWALVAFAYLAVFSSFVGLVAYEYLLDHTRPALAGSCAYVNPMIAMLLGIALGGERVTADAWAALAAVVGGVVLIAVAPAGDRIAPPGE